MNIDNEILYDWGISKMVEIEIGHPDDFLKIKETLTRIGVASMKNKTLYQSAHILFKKGKYYIVHYKEMFLLDNKKSSLTIDDISRRNRIISLLNDWGLCKVVDITQIANKSNMSAIKVVPFKQKNEWIIQEKYKIGKKT